MNEWRAFMAKYMPDGDLKDGGYRLRLWRAPRR